MQVHRALFILFLRGDLLGIFCFGESFFKDHLCPWIASDRFCSLGASANARGASDTTRGINTELIECDCLCGAYLSAGTAEGAVCADCLRKSEGKPFCQIIRKLSDNIKSVRSNGELFSVIICGNRGGYCSTRF